LKGGGFACGRKQEADNDQYGRFSRRRDRPS